MNSTAVTIRTAPSFVAAVAGFASYNHIVSVATAAGEHRAVATVLPLGIDGLIVVGTMAMLEDKRAQRVPRPMARVALGFGIVATIAANVASAHPTATARMVAAVPALAFLIAVEVLAHRGKPRTETPATQPATVAAAPVATSTPPGDNLTAIADAIVDAIPPATVTAPAPATDTPRRPARKTPARPAKGRQSNAERVASAVAKNPAWTQADVAERLQLGTRTVQRYWPKTAAAVNGHHHGEEG